MMTVDSSKMVIIKDSTLREGLDTPDVMFTPEQKLNIVTLLDKANIPEIEIVAPSRVLHDLEFVKGLEEENLKIRTSGLVYAYNTHCQQELEQATKYLNRLDILMPVSSKRKPYDQGAKIQCLAEVLDYALGCQADIGVGFPHSTQKDVDFLLEITAEMVKHGAKRITIYDTNGSSAPFEIYGLIKKLKEKIRGPLCFHGHNDLGMASANALSAVYAGAEVLDVTINGLGDRAGNASLEQVALSLHLKGFRTSVVLQDLTRLSKTVEKASGVRLSKLAPIVGEYVYCHKSPSHLETPALFEAFDPALIGCHRRITKS